MTKKWYESKTIWVNVLTLVIAILTTVVASDVIPPEIVLYITGIAVPILNVILRFVTDTPIEMKKHP